MKKYIIFLMMAILSQLAAVPIAGNYTIVIPDNANPIELKAAQQFTMYISKITDYAPVTVKEKDFDKKTKAIYIGQTAFAKSQNINFDDLDDEEWIIRTVNDELIITGGYPRGTLYGVFEYLEKHAKVLVLDEQTTIIPTNKNLEIGNHNIRFKPVINQRSIHICNSDDHPQLKEFNKGFSYFQVYNGMAKFLGAERPHHTFISYAKDWPAKPELYSMNSKGVRLMLKNGRLPGQICMTNPEARELTLKKLREFIKKDRAAAAKGNYPPPYVYDISQEDNAAKCECPSCKALALKEGSYAAPLLDFINHIAREIGKEYPDIYVRTFAYMYSEKAPKTIVAEKNVIIQLAMLGSEFGNALNLNDTARPMTHELNKKPRETLHEWSKHADNIARWDYWIIFPRQIAPTVRVNTLIKDMKYYKANNVKWLFAEFENPVWMSFFGLTRYLGYKLSENPDADSEALIKQFMHHCYGPAANTMRELLAFQEKTLDNYSKNLCATAPHELDCFNDAFYTKALALLAKAEKEANGNKFYLDRITLEYPPIYGGILNQWKNLPAMQKKFKYNDLMTEFKKVSMHTIEYRIGNTNPTLRNSCLSTLNSFMKTVRVRAIAAPLPPQFARQRGKWIDQHVYQLAKFDGDWTDFNNYQVKQKPNLKVKLVDDPDAVLGKAVLYTAPDINKVIINLSDWLIIKYLSRKKVVDVVPDDGKYHWINLGTFKNESHGATHIELPDRNSIYTGFWRHLEYGKKSTYYISLKRKGNQLYADRVLVHQQ